jgi:hypothetical protein
MLISYNNQLLWSLLLLELLATIATTSLHVPESSHEPRVHLVVKSVPLVYASAPGLIVVENVTIRVADVPKCIQGSFFVSWNSAISAHYTRTTN